MVREPRDTIAGRGPWGRIFGLITHPVDARVWARAETRRSELPDMDALNRVVWRRVRQVGVLMGLVIAIPVAAAASALGLPLAVVGVIGAGAVLISWALSFNRSSVFIRRTDPVIRRLEGWAYGRAREVPTDYFPTPDHLERSTARTLRDLTGWGGIRAAASMLLGGTDEPPDQRLGRRIGAALGLAGAAVGLAGLPIASSPLIAALAIEIAAMQMGVGSSLGGTVADRVAIARAVADSHGRRAGVRTFFGRLPDRGVALAPGLQTADKENRRNVVIGLVLTAGTLPLVAAKSLLARYLVPQDHPTVGGAGWATPGPRPRAVQARPPDHPSLDRAGWTTVTDGTPFRGQVAATFTIAAPTSAQAERDVVISPGTITQRLKRLMRVELRSASAGAVTLAIEQTVAGATVVCLSGPGLLPGEADKVRTAWKSDWNGLPVNIAVGDPVRLSIDVNLEGGYLLLGVHNLRTGEGGLMGFDPTDALKGATPINAEIAVGRPGHGPGPLSNPFLDTEPVAVTDMLIDGMPVGSVPGLQSLRMIDPRVHSREDTEATAPVLAGVTPLSRDGRSGQVLSYPHPVRPAQVQPSPGRGSRRTFLLLPNRLVHDGGRAATTGSTNGQRRGSRSRVGARGPRRPHQDAVTAPRRGTP